MSICWPYLIPAGAHQPVQGILDLGIQADFDALTFDTVPDPTANTGGTRFYGLNGSPGFAVALMTGAGSKVTFNFGATAFAHSAPSGFSAWGAATVLVVNLGTITLTNGDLTAEQGAGGAEQNVTSTTSHGSGKWYYEATIDNQVDPIYPAIGIWNKVDFLQSGGTAPSGDSVLLALGTGDDTIWYGLDGGSDEHGNRPDVRDILVGGPVVDGDVIGVAVDFDNGRIWYRRNALAWSCLGTTQAIEDFKVFAQPLTNNQINLTMEPGSYRAFSAEALKPFSGIRSLTVSAVGASLLSYDDYLFGLGSTAGFWIGNTFGDTKVLRLENVNASDTVVTVKLPIRTESTLDDFSVGNWCCLAVIDMQGHDGYPPNLYRFEYVQIAGISGEDITLTAAVTDQYLDQYQDRYNVSVTDGYDPGGPVSLHKMAPGPNQPGPDNGWDSTLLIQGLTFDCSNQSGDTAQVSTIARNFQLEDVEFIHAQPTPSVSKTWRMTGGTVDGFLEIDKTVEVCQFNDVNFNFIISQQSGSVTRLEFTNCTWDAGKGLQGTGKHTVLSNCTLEQVIVGPIGYGQAKTVTITNSVVNSLSGVSNFVLASDFTFASGDFTSAVDAVHPPAVPGLCFYGGSGRSFAFAFNTVDIRAGASNELVLETDITGSLPTLDVLFATPWLRWHPCEAMFVSNSTGCPEIVELCDDYPQGKPLFSYARRTYTGDFADSTVTLWGQLVSVSINVTSAYVGAEPTATMTFFAGYTVAPSHSALKNMVVSINTKIAGERLITPSATTGLQSGDSVVYDGSDDATDVIFAESFLVFIGLGSDTGATTPTLTVTAKTNQLSQF